MRVSSATTAEEDEEASGNGVGNRSCGGGGGGDCSCGIVLMGKDLAEEVWVSSPAADLLSIVLRVWE